MHHPAPPRIRRRIGAATLLSLFALGLHNPAVGQLQGGELTPAQAAAIDRAIALIEAALPFLNTKPKEKERLEKSLDALKKARAGKKTTKKSRFRTDPTLRRKGMQARTTAEKEEDGRAVSTPAVAEGDETVLVDPGEMGATPNEPKDAKLAGTLSHEGERLRQDSKWPKDEAAWTQTDKCNAWKQTREALKTHKITIKALAAKFIVDEKWVTAGYLFNRAARIERKIRELDTKIRNECN